jgi:transcriptional regulator with XRE-family HTH domain
MNALQQLIRDRMAERNWSYGDIARLGGLPRSTVHNLATVPSLSRPPQPTTLEKLAHGLELPLDTVRAAAASAAGYAIWREDIADPDIDVLVASLTKLTADERRHVQALIQSLLNGR